MLSTHSPELLSDPGIAPEEVLVLEPSKEDTTVRAASSDTQIRDLLEAGLPMGDVVVRRSAPKGVSQLSLFGD
jgi:hypothetical protein